MLYFHGFRTALNLPKSLFFSGFQRFAKKNVFFLKKHTLCFFVLSFSMIAFFDVFRSFGT